jgi:hypothetical protein
MTYCDQAQLYAHALEKAAVEAMLDEEHPRLMALVMALRGVDDGVGRLWRVENGGDGDSGDNND